MSGFIIHLGRSSQGKSENSRKLFAVLLPGNEHIIEQWHQKVTCKRQGGMQEEADIFASVEGCIPSTNNQAMNEYMAKSTASKLDHVLFCSCCN